MCGFAGFISRNRPLPSKEFALNNLMRMGNAIIHRGPDDQGTYYDERHHVGLCHRRLSILDLNKTGHQPMKSGNGRFIITFNGEIYNWKALKQELNQSESINWRGHSDTEILLEAFSAWGVEETLKRLHGMFAFALLDLANGTMHLARDRAGEKPLYYGENSGLFFFASELKAIKSHEFFHPEIDHEALNLFLRHNYIPAPKSIYKGIKKLEPGSIMTISADGKTKQTYYWSAVDVSNRLNNSFYGDSALAVKKLEELLLKVIDRQMIADVPVGAFLSGGIDSSTVVALMQSISTRPINTFSVGFHDKQFDEAKHAKEVAQHLKTNHTEIYVSEKDMLDIVPKLPHIYDEPFSDSSQIPTILVSEVAKRAVTVSLSGDAGDELFCGYNRYSMTQKFWGKIQPIPQFGRKICQRVLTTLPVEAYNNSLSLFSKNPTNWGDKIHKGAGVLTSKSDFDLYFRLISHWQNPSSVVLQANEPPSQLINLREQITSSNFIDTMMVLDFKTYLPDDILVKVDRASMSVSLESRVPFLDHDIIEFAWSLPLNIKLRNGQTKWPLRQVLYKHVPQSLIERPKMGFGVPLGSWLKGPLKDWAYELLKEEKLSNDGIFDKKIISQLWKEHQSGKRNWHYLLWDVLMFQSWKKENFS